jgi:3-deoxy-D-manno-octulosonic-acid transferase
VGEVTVARALLAELRPRFPHLPLVLTATTATGLGLASGAQVADVTLPFPLDLPGPTRRFLQATKPKLVLLVETELWPEMLAACGQGGIPVALVNARISDRSFPRYRRLRPLLRSLLAPLTLACAQTPQDAQRLVAIGVPAEKVRLTGNIKFDLAPARTPPSPLLDTIRSLAKGKPIFVAGSTLEGEEKEVLAAFAPLRERMFLLLAPRHPERAGGVVELAHSLGLKAVRRSPLPPPQTETEVLVLDTVGELASLYQLAFVAFVGGSLVPKGGHNPIEPARFAVPVLSGPYVANFAAVYEVFCGQQGAFLVGNGQELGEKLAYFLDHPEQAQEAGQAAQAVLQAHTGATARTVDALEPLLS